MNTTIDYKDLDETLYDQKDLRIAELQKELAAAREAKMHYQMMFENAESEAIGLFGELNTSKLNEEKASGEGAVARCLFRKANAAKRRANKRAWQYLIQKQSIETNVDKLEKERDRWRRECLETNRLDAGLQAELGKQLLEMKKERDEWKAEAEMRKLANDELRKQRGAAREDARVQREALQLVLKWKDETLEPMRQKAMDVSLAHEPCGYYCDESVGHVDHTLFNWAKYLYGDGVAPDIWEKVDAAIGTKYLKDGEQ